MTTGRRRTWDESQTKNRSTRGKFAVRTGGTSGKHARCREKNLEHFGDMGIWVDRSLDHQWYKSIARAEYIGRNNRRNNNTDDDDANENALDITDDDVNMLTLP